MWNMARESGGANNMHPLSCGSTDGKGPKNEWLENLAFSKIYCRRYAEQN